MSPQTVRDVPVARHTVRVEDHGTTNPPLVLLHAMNASVRTWDAVVAQLTEHFRVVTLDFPGRGHTPTRDDLSITSLVGDVAAVADALALGSPAIWGHSLGGFIALQYAARHPCRAVVCEDSGWGYRPQLIDPAGLDRIRADATESFDDRHLRAAVLETMRQLPELYDVISCPILLLLARGLEHEAGGARRQTARRVAGDPNLQVSWIESAEHDLHIAAQAETLDAARGFLTVALTRARTEPRDQPGRR